MAEFTHCPVTGAWMWWLPTPKRGELMREAAVDMLTVLVEEGSDGMPLVALLMAQDAIQDKTARAMLKNLERYRAVSIRKTGPKTVRLLKPTGQDVLFELQTEVAGASV